MKGYKIELQIYAEDEQEAARGKDALVMFIEMMRKSGAAVRGTKLEEAVSRLENNQFIKQQIVNFFRYNGKEHG